MQNFFLVLAFFLLPISLIAQSLLAELPELRNVKFMGLVFCEGIDTIQVSNTVKVDKYKMADKGPQGELNFPCMLRLNMVN